MAGRLLILADRHHHEGLHHTEAARQAPPQQVAVYGGQDEPGAEEGQGGAARSSVGAGRTSQPGIVTFSAGPWTINSNARVSNPSLV